jgi:hypothetical protein
VMWGAALTVLVAFYALVLPVLLWRWWPKD